MQLSSFTPPEWLRTVESDLGAFLQDHASCEKKAVGTALTLAAHYPDRPPLVKAMIGLAQEELEHYGLVFGQLEKRGLSIGRDDKDPYIHALLELTRKGTEPYLLDRLLLFGVVEARGCERFRILADGLSDPDLRQFYVTLARAEARHSALFVRLAKQYFAREEVDARLEKLISAEAEIVERLPIRVALH